MRRLLHAWCSLFGHAWTRWSDWDHDQFIGFRHERSCARCRALEVQYDGEEGIVHA